MLWKKVVFRNCFLIAFILAVLSTVGIALTKTFLPNIIPLFYGKPTGAEQLADFWLFFLIPGVSFLITTANLLISNSVKDDFVKKTLAVSALVISLMAATSVVKIILLVGFF